jgi:hypothetical protein
MGSIKGNRYAALRPRTPGGQSSASGKLANFASHLTDAERGDGLFMIEAIAPGDIGAALKNEPGRNILLPDIEQRLTGRETLGIATRKTYF